MAQTPKHRAETKLSVGLLEHAGTCLPCTLKTCIPSLPLPPVSLLLVHWAPSTLAMDKIYPVQEENIRCRSEMIRSSEE